MKICRKCFHTPLIILAGLCGAHLVGAPQVLLSNTRLYQTVTAVKDAGYLAVPNDLVAPLLKTVKTALMGGIFFTLSIGAGVTLLALFSTWIWKYACFRKPYLAIPLVLPWLAFLTATNLGGVSLLTSLYFTVVPVLTVVLTLKLTPDRLDRKGWLRGCFHGAVLLLLAFIWATQVNGGLFVNIRDRLLLTNPMGIRINDFYYRYTLYPAEVFKSLDQKMIKTCRVEGINDRARQKKLLAVLAGRNYFAVKDGGDVDLLVVATGDKLLFKNRRGVTIETSLKKFAVNPGPILKSFSKKSDQYSFFRQFTFISLLTAFPVVLYLLLHALLYRLAALFFKPDGASTVAGLLCLLIAALLVLPVRSGMEKEIPPDQIPERLQSKMWQDNVDALKVLAGRKKAWQLPADAPDLTANPRIPVRYWLARSLAHSTGPRSHTALVLLMNDPQQIVACQALYSLGKRRDAGTIKMILHKIKHSDHWYVQWYGYNALKALGWRQPLSI